MSPSPSTAERDHYARKLIDRRRREFVVNRSKEELSKIRTGLLDKVSTVDAEIIEDLIALGFTHETVGVLSFIPFIQMAWADGDVSGRETSQILKHALEAGLVFGCPAYRLIDNLLESRPSEDFLSACLFVLKRWFHAMPAADASEAKKDLLNFSSTVAEASGGVLGLFGNKVDPKEQELLNRLSKLFSNRSEELHKSLITALAVEIQS